jgi:hypothetical protein
VINPRSSAPGVCLAACLLIVMGASPAAAQDRTFFIDLHAGGQLSDSAIDTDATFTLYGEDANIKTRQEIGAMGMFDVRFGVRLGAKAGAALSVSGAEAKYDGQVAASLPNSLVINQYNNFTQDVPGMTRRELGYHLQFLYFIPASERLVLTVGAGPSFVQVQQPVIDVTVIPGTQNLDVQVPKNRGTVPAFNVGLDATYALAPRFGVGLFSRFVAGSKDFDDIADVSVTSFQIGGGVRLGF